MQFELSLATAAPPVTLCAGPRLAERALFEALDELLDVATVGIAALAQPVRLIVATKSQRLGVSARYADHVGRPVGGLVVQTLHGAAAEIIDAVDGPRPAPKSYVSVLAKRAAQREPALADALGDLREGYRTIEGPISDLFDAGFESGHISPLLEAIEELDGERQHRAAALVRVAGDVKSELLSLHVAAPAGRLAFARDALALHGPEALPARAIVIAGFSNVTGLAGDLIEALVRHRQARIFVDGATDEAPGSAGQHDAGQEAAPSSLLRLLERLRPHGAFERRHDPALQTARDIRQAPTRAAEVRDIAERCRDAIAGGCRPEELAVVTGDMVGYAAVLRTQFGRVGVPLSGISARAPGGGQRRRIEALIDVIRAGADAPMDRWLSLFMSAPGGIFDPAAAAPSAPAGPSVESLPPEATDGAVQLPVVEPGPSGPLDPDADVHPDAVVAPPTDPAWRAQMRLALRSLGAARVGQVARLDAPLRPVRLPAREGFQRRAGGGVVAARMSVPAQQIARIINAADALLKRFERWPKHATLRVHLLELVRLLRGEFGWHERDEGVTGGVLAALHRLYDADTSSAMVFTTDELFDIVEATLAETAHLGIGGMGGGVQVLDPREASGRCFARLFLVGAQRGGFPAPAREDPILPDAARRRLAVVLPDLAERASRSEDERYLFARLALAAPRVDVSWPGSDERGREQHPTPQVAAWLGTATAESVEPAATETAREAAVRAALASDWDALESSLATAWDDRPTAGVMRRLHAEFEPDRRVPSGRAAEGRIGPRFGLVGPVVEALDPRHRPLSVTTLEAFARCPWQLFVSRVLGIEPAPDPLAVLPHLDGRLRGQLVHGALERIVADPTRRQPPLRDVIARPTSLDIRWPEPAPLAELLRDVAAESLARRGIRLSGLADVLAQQISAELEIARADLMDGLQVGWEVLGAEVEASHVLTDRFGATRRLTFRVDRVDRSDDEGNGRSKVPALLDYKLGRNPIRGKRAETRRRHLVEHVRGGKLLQGVAYAVGSDGVGRYLFLSPALEQHERELQISAGDTELVEAFEHAALGIIDGWDQGAFVPRLSEPRRDYEPRACRYCEVSEACVRGDSTARARLVRWADGASGAAAATVPSGAVETAAARAWDLANAPSLVASSDELSDDEWSGGA